MTTPLDPRRYGPTCPSCGRDNTDYDNICTADGNDDADCPASRYPLADLLLDADGLCAKYTSWGGHPACPVDIWQHEVSEDETRLGYWDWVSNWLEGFSDDIGYTALQAAEPGPTYDAWIAEPDSWGWRSCGMTFTCDDDPNGEGARQNAHTYARYLRNTFPCAFVAVRAASKGLPLPIRLPLP
jgi:hypothetical protein